VGANFELRVLQSEWMLKTIEFKRNKNIIRRNFQSRYLAPY